MAQVTKEVMYELLKRMQSDIHSLKDGQREIKSEIIAMRGTMVSVQQDIHNVYGLLFQHGERLDRIERRLDLRELAEAGVPFDYNA